MIFGKRCGKSPCPHGLLSRYRAGWRVEHVAVPYDHEAAAREAEANGRPDWGRWLRAGRAGVPKA